MALPTNIIMFVDADGENVQHDPYDRLDYLVNLDGVNGMLETGETVASYTLTVLAEAAALGLVIGSTTWAPSQPSTTPIRFWLEVDSGFQANAAFEGDGAIMGVEVSITTDSTPARRRQRTVGVQVAQQ